jgi:osmotically-inducible protein OsmY
MRLSSLAHGHLASILYAQYCKATNTKELFMNMQTPTARQMLNHSLLPLLTVLLFTTNVATAQIKATTAIEETRQVGGTEAKDLDVTNRVKSAIALENSLSSFEIEVVTTKGDVHLTGMVDTQSQIEQVATIARNVNGVASVRNELKLN